MESVKGVKRMTMQKCVLQPALVTEDLRQAAKRKSEDLFTALVAAKNDWQYAVKDQDAKYERVLRLKAEYAEWRAMAERMGELLAGAQASQTVLPAAQLGSSFAVHPVIEPPRRTGTGR